MPASDPLILESLRELLMREFELPEEALRPEASLAGDLDLDSLDAVALEQELEAKTGVQLDLEDLKGVETLGDLVAMLRDRTQEPCG
jgi:acyl carrier protein